MMDIIFYNAVIKFFKPNLIFEEGFDLD